MSVHAIRNSAANPRYTVHFAAGWYILDNQTHSEVGIPQKRTKALTDWIAAGLNDGTITPADLDD